MEANNMKAMREALDDIGNACAWISANCNDGTGQTQKYMDDIISIVRRALAAPPRNCDLGSVEEQTMRMRMHCNRRKPDCKDSLGNRCKCYGDFSKENCFLCWAQMPYEEGGEK